MSKSKGNGVDPLDVIEKFGADALRFGLAYLTTETQDVRMPVEFECPHCQALVEQTKKNRVLPRVDVQEVRQGVRHAMGREAGRRGPAARGRGERAVRAGAQFLQQAVERLAVRADESGRLHAGPGRRRASWRSKTAGFSSRLATVTERSDRGARRVSLRRRGAAAVRLCLERVLQLLRGDGEGAAARPGDAGRRRSACWRTRSIRCCGCCIR